MIAAGSGKWTRWRRSGGSSVGAWRGEDTGLAAREGGRAGWNEGRSDFAGSGKDDGGILCFWAWRFVETGEWSARVRKTGSPGPNSSGVEVPEPRTDSSPASGRTWSSSFVECDAVLWSVQTSNGDGESQLRISLVGDQRENEPTGQRVGHNTAEAVHDRRMEGARRRVSNVIR